MSFFPEEYKTFAFQAGDTFIEEDNGKFAVTRILAVDRIAVAQGQAITIANQSFTATEDDFLLVVSCALGEPEFATVAEARATLAARRWQPYAGHVPMRTGVVHPGMTLMGNLPVREDELEGYRLWRAEFDAGAAGIF